MKWPTENQMVTSPMKSRDPKGETRDPNMLIRAQYLENSLCYLATIANC